MLVTWTNSRVLGEVLQRARDALGRSPEQVGALVGVSGRTIRRLEAGESDRPRRVTLESLAGFYGLDPDAVNELSAAPADPAELLAALREKVATRLTPAAVVALEGADDEAVELAMRLARSGPTHARPGIPDDRYDLVIELLGDLRRRSPAEYAEIVTAMADLALLDRARRGLGAALLRELRSAQASDIERKG